MNEQGDHRILPARTNTHVLRWFRWYIRRMVRKSFNSVRVSKDSADALEVLRTSASPLVVAMNHQSWWDPLVGLLISGELCPDRPGLAPMDREMLERFAILRRVAVFGLDPDDPASLDAMRTYVGDFMREHTGAALWLTPQGEFADPRTPIRLRPGAAAVAADHDGCRAVSIAIEYTFWLDKKPELFLHMSVVDPPDARSVAGWHRAFTRTMRSDNERLSRLVAGRSPDAFTPLLTSTGGGTSPVYNLWLRLRGKRTDLASDRTARPNPPSTTDGRPA
ncbi:MAG: lysophospholipid acyltransferase family protein [Phycisphaerales bacterium]